VLKVIVVVVPGMIGLFWKVAVAPGGRLMAFSVTGEVKFGPFSDSTPTVKSIELPAQTSLNVDADTWRKKSGEPQLRNVKLTSSTNIPVGRASPLLWTRK
jgi:hypothetical protein